MVALAATTLIVLSLHGPCYLPDNRINGFARHHVRAAAAAGAAGADGGKRRAHLIRPWDSGVDAAAKDAERRRAQSAGPPTLQFEVCNGFANQRLSIVYGIIAAKRLNRTAVLPTLLLDGTQMTDMPHVVEDEDAITTPFDHFYDVTALKDALNGANGAEVMTEREYSEATGDAEATVVYLTQNATVETPTGPAKLDR